MLGVGVVTFVVSGSLAIGLQLTSGESAKPAEKPPAAKYIRCAGRGEVRAPCPGRPATDCRGGAAAASTRGTSAAARSRD